MQGIFPLFHILQVNFSCCVAVYYIVSCRLFRFQIDFNILHIADFVLKNFCPDLFNFLENLFLRVLFACKLKEDFCLNLSLFCRCFLSRRFLNCRFLSRSFLFSRLCLCCLCLFWCIY